MRKTLILLAACAALFVAAVPGAIAANGAEREVLWSNEVTRDPYTTTLYFCPEDGSPTWPSVEVWVYESSYTDIRQVQTSPSGQRRYWDDLNSEWTGVAANGDMYRGFYQWNLTWLEHADGTRGPEHLIERWEILGPNGNTQMGYFNNEFSGGDRPPAYTIVSEADTCVRGNEVWNP